MIHSKHQQSTHQPHQQQNMRKSVGVMGTRRIFTTAFKIKVLDSYRHDKDCRQNQRATARKYGIHRRQIQKWLQCEEQLRSSVENGNTGTASSISSTGSQSDGTVTEATGNTVTPATPALNLNLARQHGDELTAQQGPPPPPHPPHGSAPSSPQYSRQTTTIGAALSLCVAPVGYHEYSSEQRLHLELEDRVHIPDIHGYPAAQVDQDRNYYVLNGDGQRDVEAASIFGSRNEVKVYQTLTSYHSPSQEQHRYGVNDISSSIHNNHSPNRHPQQREQSYGDVDSFDGRSYGLLLAPSMIKTEPASPDTAATSGPYESTDSPGGPRAPLSPASHRAADSSGGSPSSVHFVDPSRAPTSPYLHVPVHEHAHSCSPLNSEKPIPSLLHQQQERESEETTQQEKKEEEVLEKAEYSVTAIIKEETHLDEEEYDEEATASLCIDYRRPPTDESLVDSSGPVSPSYDRHGYSLPSSPRDSISVGRYRSSCSDSEMDPLASTGGLNLSGNFTRRRSFPLRFKLDVLDAFHRDKEVKENQRATARKFGINRRQVQKWLEQEAELRDEIALRGDSRQRLGPVQDVASGDSPLDLTTNYVSLLRDRFEIEHERSHFYRCDVSAVSPQNYQSHFNKTESFSEVEPIGPCNLSCSVDSHTTTSTTSSYQELSLREFCMESLVKTHCYSPKANSEVSNLSEGCEQRFSPLKRQHCQLACCYEAMPSPKRLCGRLSDMDDCYEAPPQDTPLCLVKPRSTREPSPFRTELKPSTVSSASNNPDAITFKPYLDNPVSKPAKKCIEQQRELSPISSHNNNNNNNNNNNSYNNNCQIICNLNESQSRNYDFELNLRVPVSWRPDIGLYAGFPQGNTFVSVSSLYM